MHDDFVSQLISDRLSEGWAKLKNLRTQTIAFATGIFCASAVIVSQSEKIDDDDLAMLAEIAACSTGQPASSLWLNAAKTSRWPFPDQVTIAKRLLVQIDTGRCGIRHAANRHQGNWKVGASSPSDGYN